MRWRAITIVACGGLGLLAASAGAENQSVSANPDATFSPRTVQIQPGESVTWNNAGGIHNVKFEDGSFTEPPQPSAPPWSATRSFPSPGTYAYYCVQHGAPGGRGMSGTVVVGDPGPGPGPVPAPGDTEPPDLTALTAKPQRFCASRSRKCRVIRTTVSFRLSEPGRVAVVLSRRGTVARRSSLAGERGANSLKLAGRGLRPGTYRLTLRATDDAGNRSRPASVSVTVRR